MIKNIYKIKSKSRKKGLVRKSDNALIIPIVYDKIEILSKNLFLAVLGNKVLVLNLSNEAVFEMARKKGNSNDKNILAFHYKNQQYRMFMTEEIGNQFSFYGKLLDSIEKDGENIIVVRVKGKQLHYKSMKESELEPSF